MVASLLSSLRSPDLGIETRDVDPDAMRRIRVALLLVMGLVESACGRNPGTVNTRQKSRDLNPLPTQTIRGIAPESSTSFTDGDDPRYGDMTDAEIQQAIEQERNKIAVLTGEIDRLEWENAFLETDAGTVEKTLAEKVDSLLSELGQLTILIEENRDILGDNAYQMDSRIDELRNIIEGLRTTKNERDLFYLQIALDGLSGDLRKLISK